MRRRAALLAAGAAALLASGCATPMREALPGARWSGRLALQVQGDSTRSFSAGFDLRGSPQAGELELFTPLGNTAALLRWQPGQALLRVPGEPERRADSLDALVAQATGAELPVATLFDWLDGRPTPAPGWEPDLSGRDAGRLRARRLAAPQADLRLVLERP